MFNKQTRLLALLFAFSIGALSLRAADPAPSGYSISVDIAPETGKSDTYVIRAVVSDVVSNEVLSSPKIITKQGEPAKVMVGSDSSSFTIDVLIDKSGKAASYTFTAMKSGKAVSILKGSISIQ